MATIESATQPIDSSKVEEQRYFRRVIRIRATDSPNVRLGLRQKAKGIKPTNDLITPGVITYRSYKRRMRLWDRMRRCIGLHARFYLGIELLMWPPDWLEHCISRAEELYLTHPRRIAKSIGVDVARGGDSTSFCAGDDLGILALKTWKTPDTSVIRGELLAFAREWSVPSNCLWIDSGGGGGQIGDELRRKGHKVNLIYFGAAPTRDVKPGIPTVKERRDIQMERYSYKNLRAQMYHEFHLACDPSNEYNGYGIPSEYERLLHELAPIPKLYDSEGRIIMLPKDLDSTKEEDRKAERAKTLRQLIGHSPDEADATVLMYHGLLKARSRRKISAG